MRKFINSFIKKFFKSIYQFFLTIYIFESYSKFKKVNKNGMLTFFVKSSNEVKVKLKLKIHSN